MGTNEKSSIFNILNAINVNDHTEKKGNLTYLSWSWAWQTLKKVVPNATYTVYENNDGWNYFTDNRTAWVKTGVTVDEIEYIEYLPVMDFKNKSVPVGNVTSMDVNKAIQRSLTKCIARHGLGLYIYAGEDLPEEMPTKLSEDEAVIIKNLITETKTDTKKLLGFYKVQDLLDLPYDNVKMALEKKLKAQPKEEVAQ